MEQLDRGSRRPPGDCPPEERREPPPFPPQQSGPRKTVNQPTVDFRKSIAFEGKFDQKSTTFLDSVRGGGAAAVPPASAAALPGMGPELTPPSSVAFAAPVVQEVSVSAGGGSCAGVLGGAGLGYGLSPGLVV
jgi:hypothetical protein